MSEPVSELEALEAAARAAIAERENARLAGLGAGEYVVDPHAVLGLLARLQTAEAEQDRLRSDIDKAINGPRGQKATMKLLDAIKPRLDSITSELFERRERDEAREAEVVSLREALAAFQADARLVLAKADETTKYTWREWQAHERLVGSSTDTPAPTEDPEPVPTEGECPTCGGDCVTDYGTDNEAVCWRCGGSGVVTPQQCPDCGRWSELHPTSTCPLRPSDIARLRAAPTEEKP